jgi:glycerol-3-phosphate acyltransferase PlsX
MGALLSRHLYGVAEPSIGLLTIGEEEGKGNDLVKEAFPHLSTSGLNFAGSVEGRDVPAGKTDVVVCDGFVGNVLIKTMEGTAAAVVGLLKSELTSSWRYKLPALLLRGPFARMKRKMSYDEYGGAPLVGVNGVAIVCHGSSNARAISHAVKAAAKIVDSGFISLLRDAAREDAAKETPQTV